MKPIRHRIQTTFVVGLEHWVVVCRCSRGGWEVSGIADHYRRIDSFHTWRRDAEAVACAIAIVRSFNTLTAEDHR